MLDMKDPHTYVLENMAGIRFVFGAVEERCWPVDDILVLLRQVHVSCQFL